MVFHVQLHLLALLIAQHLVDGGLANVDHRFAT